jgi:hypothetical protein
VSILWRAPAIGGGFVWCRVRRVYQLGRVRVPTQLRRQQARGDRPLEPTCHMRWGRRGPDLGDRRVRHGFLHLPMCIDGEWRWWERATWLEVFGYTRWHAHRWIEPERETAEHTTEKPNPESFRGHTGGE